ncbi:MAG: D-alanyl-D-alanine carboxypeptidase [Ruminococcus sp.]|nr:D-alanyl-D-alanine carboxypeptidase [Candidatus Copronaster equi]
MLKRLFSALIIILFLSVNCCALGSDDISAECAVVMDAQTGQVVFEKNAHKKHSMASTTKIMTSLLAVESGKLFDEITVNEKMVNVEGTSMGLKAGDSVSLEELVYGMLLPSGNDAANSTAVYLGGSTEKFVSEMNSRAKQIGMNNTNFVTPSGLDDDKHYSTAYDMALLSSQAVRSRNFLAICSATKAKLTYGNPPYERWLYNHNRLLESYDGALGIKTGFTKKSGRCLCTYARRGSVGLIAVTLNDPDDWDDHRKMLNYAFENQKPKCFSVNIPERISVVGSNVNSVKISSVKYYSTAENLSFKIYIKKFIYTPVKAGDIVGYIKVIFNNKVIDEINLTSSENADYCPKKDRRLLK